MSRSGRRCVGWHRLRGRRHPAARWGAGRPRPDTHAEPAPRLGPHCAQSGDGQSIYTGARGLGPASGSRPQTSLAGGSGHGKGRGALAAEPGQRPDDTAGRSAGAARPRHGPSCFPTPAARAAISQGENSNTSISRGAFHGRRSSTRAAAETKAPWERNAWTRDPERARRKTESQRAEALLFMPRKRCLQINCGECGAGI